jgi:hypothetical protein
VGSQNGQTVYTANIDLTNSFNCDDSEMEFKRRRYLVVERCQLVSDSTLRSQHVRLPENRMDAKRKIGSINISLQQSPDGIKAHSGLERANAPTRYSACSAIVQDQKSLGRQTDG